VTSPDPVLDVRDLRVSFRTPAGVLRAVDGVSFSLARGQVLGIVGESGSGKSVTAQAIMGLRRSNRQTICSGQAFLRGRDLLRLRERELRHVRGKEIAMIFQDPMTSLNPVHTVGWQIGEMLRLHTSLRKDAIRARSIALLNEVGIPHANRRVDDYPHQFSGGMRQRAMIAMALACDPAVLLADEPTTALDVTIQAQIIELLGKLKDVHDSSIVLISHDLGVVAGIADEVLVMYAGRAVERGPKRQIFYDPQHPYTWGLLASIPRLDRAKPRRLPSIPGNPPSLVDLPRGCAFRPRCAHAFERCEEEPDLEERAAPEHLDRCWLPVERKRSLREQSAPREGASV
jgi:peptide/nickel transport system ATP-binding protein